MSRARHKHVARRPVRQRLTVAAVPFAVAGIAVGWTVWPDTEQTPTASSDQQTSALEIAPDSSDDESATDSAPESSPTPSTDDRSDTRPNRSGDRTPTRDGRAAAGATGGAPEALGGPSDDETESEDLPEPTITGMMWLTADLNVRTEPTEDAEVVTVLDAGGRIGVTGDETDGYAEVMYDGEAHWVSAEYLSTDEPADESTDDTTEDTTETGGFSDAPCPAGAGAEAGMVPNAVTVLRAVCAEFPEVTGWGGLRPGDDGAHGTGNAVDIMIVGSVGDAIAEYSVANAGALGISEVIWEQRIWTVERASEGWRYMEDRGSPTANHFDHVHVTVY